MSKLCCQIHPFYTCYKCRIKLCEECGKDGKVIEALDTLVFCCTNCESAFQTYRHSDWLKGYWKSHGGPEKSNQI